MMAGIFDLWVMNIMLSARWTSTFWRNTWLHL